MGRVWLTRLLLFSAFSVILVTWGCIRRSSSSNPGRDDADVLDGDIPPDAEEQDGEDALDGNVEDARDAEIRDADESDSDTNFEVVPTPPATIVRSGDQGLLLRGTVLGSTGIIDPGEVLIEDTLITCVDVDCSGAESSENITIIETNGVISPGLIDSHNHLAYNFLPEWVPPHLYDDRYQWADEESYEEHIRPYADHRSANSHFCPAAKWGELRSLIHGTTTVQGQPSAQGSCINWGIRNANRYHGLGHDHMGQRIASVRDISDAEAADLIEKFDAPEDLRWTRYHVHMAEGIAGEKLLEEFDSFAGRDTRNNRHAGYSLLDYGTAILIHSIPLTNDQLDEVEETGAMIAWSPSSNIVLYGATAPIEAILERDIVVGLGPDWTPSGEDEMLAELRYALSYGEMNGIDLLTPQRLWEMATWEGAELVGLGDDIGLLEEGMRADITVFGCFHPNPYRALIESRAADVRLVLIDGQGFYGDVNLEQPTARNQSCEPFDACGTSKFICIQDFPDDDDPGTTQDQTYEDIYTALYDILEGLPEAPPEEQYERGDELLELVDCSI